MKTCSIPGCNAPSRARGWCQNHYARWFRTSTPLGFESGRVTIGRPVGTRTPIEERLLAKTRKTRGCWLWEGSTTHDQYGQIWNGRYNASGSARKDYVHRVAYELWVGPIPDGHEVDHTCRNVLCIRPEHLEAVTPEENLSRRQNANALKTHCPKGHPYDERNTAIQDNGRGGFHRVCRTCGREAQRRYQARKRRARN